MICRSYLVFIINCCIVTLARSSNRFHNDKTLTKSRDPLVKRSRSFSTVNVALPYHKVLYKPIDIAHPVGYSKKPDVYIEHVHVHNGVNPCQNSGIILHTAGGFECLCKKQYKGKHCEEKNYCYPNPCVNGGNCVEKDHNFVCNCLNGFKGAKCSEPDPCYPAPCKNGGTCSDLGHSKIECSCPRGFMGPSCEEVEHCDPNPCLHGGLCKEEKGKFTCSCVSEWTGSICEVPNRCLTNPCRNGGQCLQDHTINICKCPPGYYGRFCEDHVCHPQPCFNKGECSVEVFPDKTSSYKCRCPSTFKGDKCQIRNHCSLSPCKNGVCLDDASVYHVDLPLAGYYCICKDGFVGQNCDKKICDNCDINAVCLYGQCVCKNGYVGDGNNCKETSEICATQPCKNGGKCVPSPPNSFDCNCPRGFTGPLCETVTPCDPNPCKNGATCIVSGSSFKCLCPDGKSGPDCTDVKKSRCTPNFCLNGGKCHEPEQEGKEPYCTCTAPKFLPPNCACSCEKANKNVDPEASDPVCDLVGDCVCKDSTKNYVSGTGCTVGRADPCQYFLCMNGGTKTTSQGKCSCICLNGFTGSRCEKKDTTGTCIPNPCKNNGTCEELTGKIRCNCPTGYRQPYCEPESILASHPCGINPCKNAGICKPRTIGYDCWCVPRYTGPHCEVDKCTKCHKDADCIEGVCKCKDGFTGNGYTCLVDISSADKSCYKCPPMSVCKLGVCQCTPGYIMEKRDCIPDVIN